MDDLNVEKPDSKVRLEIIRRPWLQPGIYCQSTFKMGDDVLGPLIPGFVYKPAKIAGRNR